MNRKQVVSYLRRIIELTIFILILVFLIANLCGCLLSREQQAIKRKTIWIAGQSIEPYLNDKYGIENATVVSIKANYVNGIFSEPFNYTGAAYAKCEFNGREFGVRVESNGDCSDDYQYHEITKAIEKYLEDLTGYVSYVNNVNIYKDFTTKGGLEGGNRYFDIKEHFNGDVIDFLEHVLHLYAEMYFLISDDDTAIKEISDMLVCFVDSVKLNYRYREINAYFIKNVQKSTPELDISQLEETDVLANYLFFSHWGPILKTID